MIALCCLAHWTCLHIMSDVGPHSPPRELGKTLAQPQSLYSRKNLLEQQRRQRFEVCDEFDSSKAALQKMAPFHKTKRCGCQFTLISRIFALGRTQCTAHESNGSKAFTIVLYERSSHCNLAGVRDGSVLKGWIRTSHHKGLTQCRF